MTRQFQKDLTRALTFIFLCVSTLSFAVTSPIRPNDYTGKIRVACVGDSITYGSKIEDRQTNSYPAQLQALLGERYDVRNFGHSGARVTKDSRKPYVGFLEYAAAIEFKPHVVIICLGINDVSVKEWQRNKPQFVQDYKELITDFQTLPVLPKPKVWLGSLMPVVPPYEPYVAIQKTKAEADMMIDQVAKELGLPLIDLFTRLNMEPQFFPDGLHPDKNGAAIIAQMTCKAITGDFGGLRMPWVFGDHMVLQRQILIPVFGTADVGSVVSVELGPNKQKATVDHNGRWRVDMPAMQTGRAQTLTCSDGTTELTFSDVLIGEVWYASGQSNMDWQMRQDADWATEGLLADKYPDVRLLNRQGNPSGGAGKWFQTQIDNVTVDSYFSGQWQVGSQQSAAPISAVAYYFGREIHKATGVPVGIIDNSKGGAPMEAFMPREALATKELYGLTQDWINAGAANNWHRGRAKQNLNRWFESPQNSPMPHHPFEPTFLFNADTEDVIPFAIRGVIWYQGESNATDSTQRIAWDQEHNRRLFEGLITSWRQRWGQGNLPFYYVQLPNLNRNWMLFREMQLQTLNALPNLGMAVTIDVGHPTNVHPKAKQEVARRLSLWARAKVYGENGLVYSGPLHNKMLFTDEAGTLRVGFDHVGKGLTTSDGKPVKGFEIADAFGDWHPAEAKIDGKDVVVFNAAVATPQAVRYAWAPNPQANLCNSEKLPASPFRSGNFEFKGKPARRGSDVSSPTIVGVPPVDAGRGLIRVSETEIRHYGGRGAEIYLVSYDNGRTWQEKPLPENYPDLIGLTKEGPSFAHIPGTDEFLRVSHSSKGKLYRTQGGLDGQWVVIKDKDGSENPFQGILHHPVFAKDGNRWIIPAHRGGMWVYYSDDQGQTWSQSNRVHTPAHRPGGIHKGTRWNHDAAEPCIVRLNDGRLWRLIRCAQDNHYESFSGDDGQTWTEPVPSRFYGTITMPDVGRLRDGRLLMVWNNTTPLPELERATGRGEDVFTNRDVLHAAISEDDGKTWIGFREVILDEHRNDSDYAVTAGSNDRGKQQNEFLELEDGIVLLAVGQHPLHRKLMIMDVSWLYETVCEDDFSQGLKNWSVHKYIEGIRGHCGYNRKQGASLIPHPDDKARSVLRVRRAADPELVCENDGAAWNFPAAQSGVFITRIRLQDGFKGGRISLIDRWFNPTDLSTHLFAMFNLEIPTDGRINNQTALKKGQWFELKFEWDGLENEDMDNCTLYINDVPQAAKLNLNRQSINGISYVHFISTAREIDDAGFLIESVASNSKSYLR